MRVWPCPSRSSWVMRSRQAVARFRIRLYVLALVTVLWPAHARADWIVSAEAVNNGVRLIPAGVCGF